MVDEKTGGLNKRLVSLAIGVFLVCLLIAIAILAINYFGLNVSPAPGKHLLTLMPAANANMTDDQLWQTMGILQSRFAEYGDNVTITSYRDLSGVPYVFVYYNDIPPDLIATVATAPGLFEMRVQTSGNESDNLFYGDGINSVSAPQTIPIWVNTTNGSGTWDIQGAWSVNFKVTGDDMDKFRRGCIDAGATKDQANHTIIMLLDDEVIYQAPMSTDLAGTIAKHPLDATNDSFFAMTGPGEDGKAMAMKLSMCLRGGALPVKIEIVSDQSY